MIVTSAKSRRAAAHWLTALMPKEDFERAMRDGTAYAKVLRDIRHLAEIAFYLYEQEWKGIPISDWEFPFEQLQEEPIEQRFRGADPWNVLLRKACLVAESLKVEKAV